MLQIYRAVGIMPAEPAVHRVLDSMESLSIRHVNPMHGATIPADALPPHIRALRQEPFAYGGPCSWARRSIDRRGRRNGV